MSTAQPGRTTRVTRPLHHAKHASDARWFLESLRTQGDSCMCTEAIMAEWMCHRMAVWQNAFIIELWSGITRRRFSCIHMPDSTIQLER